MSNTQHDERLAALESYIDDLTKQMNNTLNDLAKQRVVNEALLNYLENPAVRDFAPLHDALREALK